MSLERETSWDQGEERIKIDGLSLQHERVLRNYCKISKFSPEIIRRKNLKAVLSTVTPFHKQRCINFELL